MTNDEFMSALDSNGISVDPEVALAIKAILDRAQPSAKNQGEKRLAAHMKVEQWGKKQGIIFVNRSYGPQTSNVVGLDALVELATN